MISQSRKASWHQYHTNRRKLLMGAGAGAGLAAIGASRLAPTMAQDTVEIEFWTPGGSAPFCEGFEEITVGYEELAGNVDVTEVTCGVGDQSFNEVLLARIAAGNPPDATVL
ncbi:MAG: hypothetical protein H0V37_01640 [Chloroflexia bacterium]|nr:hypothetical protein [Chloroflexia bacterium]